MQFRAQILPVRQVRRGIRQDPGASLQLLRVWIEILAVREVRGRLRQDGRPPVRVLRLCLQGESVHQVRQELLNRLLDWGEASKYRKLP
jgi:hypothetical protein